MPEQEPTYEDARDQLVEVVRRLEQGGDSLAESIALWEKGEHLARTCQTWLDGARSRLDHAIEAQKSDTPESDTAESDTPESDTEEPDGPE